MIDSSSQNFNDQLTAPTTLKHKPEELINFGSSTPNKEYPESATTCPLTSNSSLSSCLDISGESVGNASAFELSEQSMDPNRTEDLIMFSSSSESNGNQADMVDEKIESETNATAVEKVKSTGVIDVTPKPNVQCPVPVARKPNNATEYKVGVMIFFFFCALRGKYIVFVSGIFVSRLQHSEYSLRYRNNPHC